MLVLGGDHESVVARNAREIVEETVTDTRDRG